MNTSPQFNTQPTTQRIRHEMKMRRLTVARVQKLTPRMVRITLQGEALSGFVSAAPDDHVKLFFPAPGSTTPILPKGPPGSPEAMAGPTPIARDYTPRRYDPVANELDIDFVLHSEGPATTWAAQAQPGHQLGVGGPRGSFIINGVFDWYLLIADEAGLPALARRLEELPATARAFVFAEVQDNTEQLELQSPAKLHIEWVHRNHTAPGTPELLQTALRKWVTPAGTGYTWIACESNASRTLRMSLLERGLDKQWIKAAGYWRHGASATHDKHED